MLAEAPRNGRKPSQHQLPHYPSPNAAALTRTQAPERDRVCDGTDARSVVRFGARAELMHIYFGAWKSRARRTIPRKVRQKLSLNLALYLLAIFGPQKLACS